MITFTAPLQKVGSATILQLPDSTSKQLPSRGQVAVKALIQDQELTQVVEPDGRSGHWFRISTALSKKLGVSEGDMVTVEMILSKDWPEPSVPEDFQKALAGAPAKVQEIWNDITPMARWEWVRWVNATNVVATRARRVEVSMSKMDNGKRRPCCFNLASCTDPELSKSGKLAI